MATTISVANLTASTALASGDSIPFLDVSDTTQSPGGSVDRITVANFFGGTSRVPVPFKQALGTITTSTPALDSTVTWNAAVTFTHILVNVTDTSSNAASKFLDFQIAAASKFAVTKAGAVSFASDLTINSNKFVVTGSSGAVTIADAVTIGTTLAMGGSNTTSMGTGDISIPDSAYYRTANAANSDTVKLIGRIGSTNTVEIDPGQNIITFGGMSPTNANQGVLCIKNASAPPSGNPSSGYFLWAEGGALKGRGGSGTVVTIGAA